MAQLVPVPQLRKSKAAAAAAEHSFNYGAGAQERSRSGAADHCIAGRECKENASPGGSHGPRGAGERPGGQRHPWCHSLRAWASQAGQAVSALPVGDASHT